MPAAPAPWRDPAATPRTPDAAPAGVIVAGHPAGCEPGELAARVAADTRGRIAWGWSPDGDRVVPVAAIAEAAAGVVARDRKLLARVRRDGLVQAAVIAALVGTSMLSAGGVRAALLVLPMVAFALLGLQRALEAGLGLRRLRRDPDRYREQVADEVRFGHWIARRRTPMAQALAASVALAALAQGVHGLGDADFARGIAIGGLVPAATRDGQWWRLLSYGLLHGGVMHLVFNLLSLYPLARLTEALAGRAAVALVFVSAVAVGGAASLVLPPEAVTTGASGGIFGLVGFLIAWSRSTGIAPPSLRGQLWRGVAVMAIVGALYWQLIDNAAHGGGLLAGLALGACAPRDARERRAWSIAGWTCAAAWAAVAATIIALLLPPR